MSFHGGLLGKLAGGAQTLFGGRDDPRLSPEANRAASSDALVTAGLTTLLAQGPGGVSPTTLQALSQGALAGREAGVGARETQLQRDQQAQLQELVDSGSATPQMLQEVFMQLLANGDTEGARAVAEVLKTVNANMRPAIPRTETRSIFNPEIGANEDVMFNKDDGTEIAVLGRSSVTNTARPRVALEDDQGRKFLYYLNPDGTKELIGLQSSAGEGGQRAEEQAALRRQMQIANENMVGKDHLMSSIPAQIAADASINRWVRAGANWWFKEGNPGESPETQEVIVDALAFVNSGVRFFSGQQMTTQEFDRYWTSWIPQPGEGVAGIAAKARKRAIIAEGDASGRWEQMEKENPDMTREEFRQLIDREAAERGLDQDSSAFLRGN